MHVALNDAGLTHPQVADHQQLVQVLLVRGLHPGGRPAVPCVAEEEQPGWDRRGTDTRSTSVGARVRLLRRGGGLGGTPPRA